MDRSYYYEYVEKTKKKPATETTKLEETLIALFNKHKGNYGSRRLAKELQELGFEIGRYKVRTLMKKLNLKVKIKTKYKITTVSAK
ncbi:IS3 family transposase [Spartinivicinus marinus]|uniref:IS3 family transposase n=1 Tax=Spartinivicinus marinus TaxID=2994442 RepID=UPI00224EBD60|nr:IS3 family transposase [Spartinivicinus marinus]